MNLTPLISTSPTTDSGLAPSSDAASMLGCRSINEKIAGAAPLASPMVCKGGVSCDKLKEPAITVSGDISTVLGGAQTLGGEKESRARRGGRTGEENRDNVARSGSSLQNQRRSVPETESVSSVNGEIDTGHADSVNLGVEETLREPAGEGT
jgi:hypothetical protein